MKTAKGTDTNPLVNVYLSIALSCGVTSCVTAVAFTWKAISFRCFHYSIIVFLLGISDGCIATVLLFRYWIHECLGFDFQDYSYLSCRTADAIGSMCITTSVWLMTLFALERCINRLHIENHKKLFNNLTILKFFAVIECLNAAGFLLNTFSKEYVSKIVKTSKGTFARCRTTDTKFTSNVCYGIIDLFLPMLIITASITLIITKSGRDEASHRSEYSRQEKADSIKEFAGFAFVYFTALLISFSYDISSSYKQETMATTTKNLVHTLGLTGVQCALAFHIRFWRRFRKQLSSQRREERSTILGKNRSLPASGKLTTEGPFSIGQPKRIPVSNESKEKCSNVRGSSSSASSIVDGVATNLENETDDSHGKTPVNFCVNQSDATNKHLTKIHVPILSHFKLQKKPKLGKCKSSSFDGYADSPQISEMETESEAYPVITPPKDSILRTVSSHVKETISQLKPKLSLKNYDTLKPETNLLVDIKNLRLSTAAGTSYDTFKQSKEDSFMIPSLSAMKRSSTKQFNRASSTQVKWHDTPENEKSTINLNRKSRHLSTSLGPKLSISKISELISSENILKFKNSSSPESSKDVDLKDNEDDKR